MRTETRQALQGMLAALFSLILIFSSIMLSLLESGAPVALLSSATPTFDLASIPTLADLLPGELTLTALAVQPTKTPSATAGVYASCAPPEWRPVIIQSDDTLQSLAQTYAISVEDLLRFNCLPPDADSLPPGTQLYVPPAPAPTLTPSPSLPPSATPCVPRLDWLVYYVRSGDTLYALSRILGISVYDLQRANCLTSDRIRVGQPLRVPFIPVFTPVPTYTATLPPFWTPTGMPTPSPTAPTLTFTPTPTPTLTTTPGGATSTPTPTATLPPTPTATVTSTVAPPAATNTATSVPPTPTATNIPAEPATSTPTPPTVAPAGEDPPAAGVD